MKFSYGKITFTLYMHTWASFNFQIIVKLHELEKFIYCSLKLEFSKYVFDSSAESSNTDVSMFCW